MNIWLLNSTTIAPFFDKQAKLSRTVMMVEELNKRGHNISWFTGTFKHIEKKHLYHKDTVVQVNEHYKIYLSYAPGYKKNISIGRVIYNKIISLKFKKISKTLEKPDLIYVSFPIIDYAAEAVKYGKKYNVPVIVDVRDLWPDIFKHNLPKILGRIVSPYISWMDCKTKKIMKDAFALNAVSEAILNWGIKKGNRKKSINDRYFYIGFLKQENVVQNQKDDEIIDENKFNILFSASINNQFDYECITKLAEILEEKDKDIVINICGDGPQMEKLKKQVSKFSNVRLLGWIGKDKLNYILQNSQIGLAPYKNTFDFQMGVSNKFSQYTAYGLPIVLTSEGYMKELIEKYKCGISTQNMEKMSNFIINLKNNTQEYRKVSDNAMQLYEEKFVASKIYKELVDYLEKIKENN